MELLQMGVAITGDDVCHQVDDGSYDNSNGPYAELLTRKKRRKRSDPRRTVSVHIMEIGVTY